MNGTEAERVITTYLFTPLPARFGSSAFRPGILDICIRQGTQLSQILIGESSRSKVRERNRRLLDSRYELVELAKNGIATRPSSDDLESFLLREDPYPGATLNRSQGSVLDCVKGIKVSKRLGNRKHKDR